MAKDKVVVDGVTYVREQAKPGKRAVVIVDRGWIFAGDVNEKDGRILLTRAVWVFKWDAIGFDAMIANPKHKSVTLRPMDRSVDVPSDAEIFRVSVADDWGL